MATFLVRVALHGVPDTDDAYGELDTVLLHYDFTRSILGAEGNEYALPPGPGCPPSRPPTKTKPKSNARTAAANSGLGKNVTAR
jgi:hypothetical protein